MISIRVTVKSAILVTATMAWLPSFAQTPALEIVPVEADTTKPAAPNVTRAENSISADDAKMVARKAYDIFRSGDVFNPDFEYVVTQLKRVRDTAPNAKQEEIARALLNALNSLSNLGLRSETQNKVAWSTEQNGGAAIKSLKNGLDDRKKQAKESAGKIAVEYLAIGDLADKLQMTTQDFQKAMGEREALTLSIKALNAAVKTELSNNDRYTIDTILHAVYSPSTEVGSTSAPSSATGDATTAPSAGDEQYVKAVEELVGASHQEIAKSLDPAAAYAAWARQVWDRKIQAKHLALVTKSISVDKNVFAIEDELNRILALVDAVPAINNNSSQKAWTPNKQVMRVRRVAAQLHFWTMYARAVTGELLKSSRRDFDLADLPEESTNDPRLEAAAQIYQRIRVSLWPIVGGSEGDETPDNKQLSPGKTYQLKAGSPIVTSETPDTAPPICNYTLPNPKEGQWVRFAIPPAPRPTKGEQTARGAAPAFESNTFEGEKLENSDWHRWKIMEFTFEGMKWQCKVGRKLDLSNSYRLTAGGIFIAPEPTTGEEGEVENTFSVAVPPNASQSYSITDSPDSPGNAGATGEASTLDLSVTILGLQKPRLKNEASDRWRVIQYVWNGKEWDAFEGDAEALRFLKANTEVHPAKEHTESEQ